MEYEADRGEPSPCKAGEQLQARRRDGLVSLHGIRVEAVRQELKRAVRSLVERYGVSREDLLSVYDECLHGEDGEYEEYRREVKIARVENAAVAVQVSNNGGQCVGGSVRTNGSTHFVGGLEALEEGEGGGEEAEVEEIKEREIRMETGRNGNGHEEERTGEEKEEVDKMQTLVQSALRVYEASSSSPTAVEVGQKRRCFTLEEELTTQPSPFAAELLDRDQSVVAQAIKKYMNQYSVPQREVVEKTGLNQSHLSQHFLHGVTMKRSKRVKLYHWFEEDQKVRTGKLSTAVGALNSVLDSPKVEGNRRRPRWKWSPISTQILTEAFKKNHFPTRDQRVELAKVCNEAELAMNNGSPIRGPEGDTEGITEQRVNTWFTNRRKGLSTPSPTRALAMGPNNPTPIFTHPQNLPTLLRATTPTTPTRPYHTPHTIDTEQQSEDGCFSPGPVTVQTLVNHIQQAQASSVSSPRAIAVNSGMGVSVQLTGSPVNAPHLPQAVPLAAIALPGSVPNTIAITSQPSTTPLTPPLQAFAINADGVPTAIIPHAQLQAILSQVQVSSSVPLPGQLQLANASGGVITIPMIHTGQKVTAANPMTSQFLSAAPKSTASLCDFTSAVPLPLPQLSSSSTTTAYTTLSPLPSAHAPLPTVIGSNQVQALLSQLQQQQVKLQGSPQMQYNPTSSLPLAITLPGASNEDVAKALLINQVQCSSEP